MRGAENLVGEVVLNNHRDRLTCMIHGLELKSEVLSPSALVWPHTTFTNQIKVNIFEGYY